MIVTSETNLSDLEIVDAYHNLWRIEESFKVMKSQLDARPVYFQNKESIIGHFLICYLSVLLLRLFQFHVLEHSQSTESIMSFTRNYKLVKISDTKYINLTKKSDFISSLSSTFSLPLTSYYLSDSQIKKVLIHKV